MRRPPAATSAVVVTAVLAVTAAVAVSVGSVTVPVGETLRIVGAHLGLVDATGIDPTQDQIVWNFRVPRVLLAVVVGAGLTAAGTTVQAVVRNPLGDPYLLGIMSGASLGAALVIIGDVAVLGSLSVSLAAFVGANAAFAVAYLLGASGGGRSPHRMVLAGVAVAYLLSAATFYLQIGATPDQLRRTLFWSLGSLAGASWGDLAVPTIAVAVCVAWLAMQGRKLDAFALGDDTAAGVGIDVRWFQLGSMAACTLLSAVVVAVAGGIGFVGLMVPHLVRLVVGHRHRAVLLVGIPFGGLFLVATDLLARTLQRPTELPIGIVTSAFGAPAFLWLLARHGRSAHAG